MSHIALLDENPPQEKSRLRQAWEIMYGDAPAQESGPGHQSFSPAGDPATRESGFRRPSYVPVAGTSTSGATDMGEAGQWIRDHMYEHWPSYAGALSGIPGAGFVGKKLWMQHLDRQAGHRSNNPYREDEFVGPPEPSGNRTSVGSGLGGGSRFGGAGPLIPLAPPPMFPGIPTDPSDPHGVWPNQMGK